MGLKKEIIASSWSRGTAKTQNNLHIFTLTNLTLLINGHSKNYSLCIYWWNFNWLSYVTSNSFLNLSVLRTSSSIHESNDAHLSPHFSDCPSRPLMNNAAVRSLCLYAARPLSIPVASSPSHTLVLFFSSASPCRTITWNLNLSFLTLIKEKAFRGFC